MRFRDEHKKMTRFFGVILALALWVSSAAVGHARTEISIYDWSGSAAGTGLQTFINQIDRFKITPFFSKWVEIDFDIIRPALERIISGDVAPETGLEEAQRLANSLLQ